MRQVCEGRTPGVEMILKRRIHAGVVEIWSGMAVFFCALVTIHATEEDGITANVFREPCGECGCKATIPVFHFILDLDI